MSSDREVECLCKIINRLLDFILEAKTKIAVSAKGEIMPATIVVGGKGATFTFTEFDGATPPNKVASSGPITFASDNPAVAVIDPAAPVVNADGSVSVQVDAVGPGIANITGVDSASQNKVAGGDVLTVTPAAAGVAVLATGALVAN
jgi:hypothetical protein